MAKKKENNWLSKYDVLEAENGIEGTMGGLTDQGFNYNGAWGGTMQMGGSLPGAVGFSYARTQSPAPNNGKYAKKTKASAQNGEEMKYYQEGLDWKPKTISRDGTMLDKFKDEEEKTYGSYPLPEVVVTPSPSANTNNSSSKGMISPRYTNTLLDKAGGVYRNFMHSQPVENIKDIAPLIKLFDPSGISNWPDLYNAIKSGNSEDISTEAIASLPLVGKAGKYVTALDAVMKGKKTGIPISKIVRHSFGAKSFAKDASSTINKKENGGWLSKFEEGGDVIEDDRGQWEHPGEITKINSNEITMQGVDYPVLGISDTGDTQMMQPGQDYTYEGESVTEYPMLQKGGKVKPLIVNNKNDPRLKAYNDSTEAFNLTDRLLNGEYENGVQNYARYKVPMNLINKLKPESSFKRYKGLVPVGKEIIGTQMQGDKSISQDFAPIYKKPNQQVIYKNPKVFKKSTVPANKTKSKSKEALKQSPLPEKVVKKEDSMVQLMPFGLVPKYKVDSLNNVGYKRAIGNSYINSAGMETYGPDSSDAIKKGLTLSPSRDKQKNGGSTSSTITCPNCGWTWKKSEAGNDPYVCHKCGMNNASKIQNSKKENGGWLNKYN